MTPWLLAAALLVLTAPGLLACEPDPSLITWDLVEK